MVIRAGAWALPACLPLRSSCSCPEGPSDSSTQNSPPSDTLPEGPFPRNPRIRPTICGSIRSNRPESCRLSAYRTEALAREPLVAHRGSLRKNPPGPGERKSAKLLICALLGLLAGRKTCRPNAGFSTNPMGRASALVPAMIVLSYAICIRADLISRANKVHRASRGANEPVGRLAG